jgi:GT2 family glycosyltransferase
MKASIVILNWNGKADECIDACKSALNQRDVEKEILFIDNGSTNGSDLVIEQQFPEIKIIRTEKNLGVAGGRNFGATYARGEIIFFLENDGVWENPHLVDETIQLFETNNDLGAVSTLVIGFHDGECQSPCYDINEPELTLAASFNGGACALRRSAFEACGSFPGDFFRQGEERFLTLLLYEKGYKVCYWKKHRMLHKGSSYAGKNATVRRLNFEHEMKTIVRLFPSTIYRQLFWLKVGAWFFRFAQARDLKYFSKVVPQLPKWLKQHDCFQHVSEKTVALIESIFAGDFRFKSAQDIDIKKLEIDHSPSSIILRNFSRKITQ